MRCNVVASIGVMGVESNFEKGNRQQSSLWNMINAYMTMHESFDSYDIMFFFWRLVITRWNIRHQTNIVMESGIVVYIRGNPTPPLCTKHHHHYQLWKYADGKFQLYPLLTGIW